MVSCFCSGLQWGRDLVIAEMRGVVGIRQISEIASMGPRSGDRGNLLLDLDEYMRPAPLQWGRDLVIAEMRITPPWGCAKLPASMGPRSGDRGNQPGSRRPHLGKCGLQWGRDLVIAEMRAISRLLSSRRYSFNGAAIW